MVRHPKARLVANPARRCPMTTDVMDLKDAIERYPYVTIHHKNGYGQIVSVKCTYGQNVAMVGESTIVIAWAMREYGRVRARLATIELERVLMVVTEYPLMVPDCLERLFWIRGANGRFHCVKTQAAA
jgi:hypothetical protein